jgi:hypothetical protein
MANKTKSKRKYIKRSKKIYGGFTGSPSLAEQQLANKELSKLPYNSSFLDPTKFAKDATYKALNNNLSPEYKKVLENPIVNKVMDNYSKARDPNSQATLESNLQLILKLIVVEGNHLTDMFINNIAKELNIDLNQSADQIIIQLKSKIGVIIDILKSSQGKEFVAELEELFNEGLTIFKPIMNKTLDEFNKTLEKELKLLVRIGNTAATEFPPFFLAEEFMNFLTALITALKSTAKIFPEVAEALDKIESFKEKVLNMQGKFSGLINQNLRTKLNSNVTQTIPSINQKLSSSGGSLMKKLIKERKIIGGSIEKSRADFLNPNLTLSQLIRPHHNKSKKRAKL